MFKKSEYLFTVLEAHENMYLVDSVYKAIAYFFEWNRKKRKLSFSHFTFPL